MQLTPRMKDLAGQTFGSLTALRPLRLSPQGTVVWEFRCVCGKSMECIGNNAVSTAKQASNPAVPSCGCVKVQRASEVHTTHGYSRHPLHYAWQAMKQRCNNPNHPEFKRYGGKGVSVCAEWLDDSGAFIQWALSNGWEKGLHLDKDAYSDTQGIQRVYSPDTCRFTTAKENVGYSASRENHKHNARIRLTPEDVQRIKEIYSSGELNQYELADRYGVKQVSIWRAVHSST